MRIEKVSFTALLDSPLLKEYAAECSIPEIGEIKPSALLYASMESKGFQHCFGAFQGDMLVGFASLLTTVYPHYSVKCATLESLFVGKQYRKMGAGTDLMRFVQQFAKEAGCKAILYSAPAGGQLERVLSNRKSMRRTNTVYCQPLDPK